MYVISCIYVQCNACSKGYLHVGTYCLKLSLYTLQGDINDKTMCSQLWCYDSSVQRCVSRAEQRAANGTTCGNKKVLDIVTWPDSINRVYDDKRNSYSLGRQYCFVILFSHFFQLTLCDPLKSTLLIWQLPF